MTREKFDKLSLSEKKKILLERGSHLAGRNSSSYRVYLFSLDQHYVELYYLRSTNQLMWIEIQESKQILNEYLDQIQLPDWLK